MVVDEWERSAEQEAELGLAAAATAAGAPLAAAGACSEFEVQTEGAPSCQGTAGGGMGARELMRHAEALAAEFTRSFEDPEGESEEQLAAASITQPPTEHPEQVAPPAAAGGDGVFEGVD